MNKLTQTALKVARLLYLRQRGLSNGPSSGIEWNPDYASGIISSFLQRDEACMIARFGSIELKALASYYLFKQGKSGWLSYIKGESPLACEWNDNLMGALCYFAGYYPQESYQSEYMARFCKLMLDAIPELDVLGSWLNYEKMFEPMHHAKKINVLNLEPYMGMSEPWTQHLAGKKVLVVHPFTQSIEQQYTHKRTLLFSSEKILPEFELKLVQAVQSMGNHPPPQFPQWFDALAYMKEQIDAQDYDICLLGCGAYGFPLAAHVKRQGKKAIHVGGSLQLFFGIKGKRWVEQYGDNAGYNKIFNEHWIYPHTNEKPQGIEKVEDACYW